MTIKVTVQADDGGLLAEMNFERLSSTPGSSSEVSEYSVHIAVQNLDEVKLFQRSFFHNRLKRNVLNLLFEALCEIEMEDLQFERKADPSDLERRLPGTMPALQKWARTLSGDRSSVRRRQPKQPGSD